MENLVISSTSTCKHPQLEQLNIAVERMVLVFDAIPLSLQMDGLDIIQGVVSLIMQKITHGRITAVKFVPFEKSDSPSPRPEVHIKEEPVDLELESALPSPTWTLNTPMTSSNPSPTAASSTSTTPYTRRNNKRTPPSQTPTAAKKVTRSRTTTARARTLAAEDKRQEPAAKPVGMVVEKSVETFHTGQKKINPLSPSSSLETVPKSKRTPSAKNVPAAKPIGKTPAAKAMKVVKDTPKSSPVAVTKTSPKSPVAIKEAPKSPAVAENAAETTAEENGDAVNSRLNGPFILSPVKDFKTTEEILAMFPEEVIKPKKKKIHWREKTDLSKQQLMCPQCPYHTDKQEDMDIHLIAHTEDRNYTCNLCDKKFTAPHSLKRHLMIHKGDRTHHCPICNKAFFSPADLRQHAITHTGEHAHACKLCGKSYTLSANLRRHMRVHTGEKPYKCEICPDVAFRDYTSLKFHTLKHTGEKPYECNIQECKKSFRTSSDLIRHKRIHSNVASYTCDICGRGFVQKATLVAHLRVHTDIYLYKCELCGKRFRTKSSQQHHMRWHAGIKPYKCDTCSKSFSTKTYLRNHQVIHTKSKPFKCKVCKTSFNQSSNLARHERIHGEERKYKCRFCPKAFKYTNALSYHEGIHTGVKEVCEKCGAAFRTRKTLLKHVCQSLKEEEDVKDVIPLEIITKDTSQSLSESAPTSKADRLLKVKISPKKSPRKRKGKEEEVDSDPVKLHLKQACVCLEKLNPDCMKEFCANVKGSTPKGRGKTATKKSPVTVKESPMAAKRIKVVAETITNEEKESVNELPILGTAELIHAPPKVAKKGKASKRKFKGKGKGKATKSASHLKVSYKSYEKEDDDQLCVAGDMELSVEDIKEEPLEALELELDEGGLNGISVGVKEESEIGRGDVGLGVGGSGEKSSQNLIGADNEVNINAGLEVSVNDKVEDVEFTVSVNEDFEDSVEKEVDSVEKDVEENVENISCVEKSDEADSDSVQKNVENDRDSVENNVESDDVEKNVESDDVEKNVESDDVEKNVKDKIDSVENDSRNDRNNVETEDIENNVEDDNDSVENNVEISLEDKDIAANLKIIKDAREEDKCENGGISEPQADILTVMENAMHEVDESLKKNAVEDLIGSRVCDSQMSDDVKTEESAPKDDGDDSKEATENETTEVPEECVNGAADRQGEEKDKESEIKTNAEIENALEEEKIKDEIMQKLNEISD